MRFYSCNPRIIALYLVKVSIKMDPDVTQIYAPRTLKYIFMIVCYTGFKRYNTCISISWIETASVYSMFLPDKSCRQVADHLYNFIVIKNSLLFKLLSTCKPRKKNSQGTQLADVWPVMSPNEIPSHLVLSSLTVFQNLDGVLVASFTLYNRIVV